MNDSRPLWRPIKGFSSRGDSWCHGTARRPNEKKISLNWFIYGKFAGNIYISHCIACSSILIASCPTRLNLKPPTPTSRHTHTSKYNRNFRITTYKCIYSTVYRCHTKLGMIRSTLTRSFQSKYRSAANSSNGTYKNDNSTGIYRSWYWSYMRHATHFSDYTNRKGLDQTAYLQSDRKIRSLIGVFSHLHTSSFDLRNIVNEGTCKTAADLSHDFSQILKPLLRQVAHIITFGFVINHDLSAWIH